MNYKKLIRIEIVIFEMMVGHIFIKRHPKIYNEKKLAIL